MDASLPSIFAALAFTLVLALPIALRSRAKEPLERDLAWRDELPPVLRVSRPLLRWYASSVDAGLTTHKREVIQSQLNAAGAAYLITPAELIVIRRVACVIALLIALYVLLVLNVRGFLYVVLVCALVPFGYIYPDVWLRDARKKRQSRFEKEFPFFLDIVVLAMKAGLTFTAAVEQAVEQLGNGPVRDEFSRYLRETRTGVTRRASLDRLAARVLIPSVTNFAASVTQAEETGGSLGEVLADQARQRRQ